jgi:RimJ/RimL family protein N-acetyltransferase
MKVDSKNFMLKNGRQITLRSASPSDAENILRHLRITHAESYRNLNQSADHWNKFLASDEEKILADFESSPAKFMLVALDEGRIVGGMGFWGYQSEFVKHSAGIGMSIQKEFCGTGLGTEMMKYMLVQAKQMGFRRVELTVRTFNEAGIKLYEKVGFERVGLLKDAAFIDGEYVNEYSYQKILS